MQTTHLRNLPHLVSLALRVLLTCALAFVAVPRQATVAQAMTPLPPQSSGLVASPAPALPQVRRPALDDAPSRQPSPELGPPPEGPASAPAADGEHPAWRSIHAPPLTSEETVPILSPRMGAGVLTDAAAEALTYPSEATITPEIQALARGLRNDPRLIFEYVHNYVDYVPTFGAVNGAFGTLMAGRGNDMDQSSLFIALMSSAGYTATYMSGVVTYTLSRVANWVGVPEVQVTQVLQDGGMVFSSAASGQQVALFRVWAAAQIGGQTYWFDPAMKEYQEIAGVDLGPALGYDRSTFLARARAGAVVTSDSVQNLNESNIRADLATYSMNLVQYLRQNLPEASMQEVIGGRSIVPLKLTAYSAQLPFAQAVGNLASGAQLNDTTRHKLRVQFQGIDRTFASSEIMGRRLSIVFLGSNLAANLILEGRIAATGNATTFGDMYECTLSVDHAYPAAGGTYCDEGTSFELQSGGIFVLMHDFGEASASVMAGRRDLLYLSDMAGYADNAELMFCEGMWNVGLGWIYQYRLAMNLLDRMAGTLTQHHHIVGVVGQTAGYWVHIPLDLFTTHALEAGSDTRPAQVAGQLLASALEHGILEQLQGTDRPAVSTVKLLQLHNQMGRRTFLAQASNWATVRAQLRNYSAEKLQHFADQISAGWQILLPEDANTRLNQWSGVGYIELLAASDDILMSSIISGGYSGGACGQTGMFGLDLLMYDLGGFGGVPADQVAEVSTPTGGDPVNLATGDCTYTTADLSVGASEPFGLRLLRYYDSGSRYFGSQLLGRGWKHSYDMTVGRRSKGELALGTRQPVEAASLMAWAHVALDLLQAPTGVSEWLSAVVATKWAMDQMLDHTLTVQLGQQRLEFTRLADGSYAPPPGMVLRLTTPASGYLLETSAGARYEFDTGGRITRWQDANSNALTFTYDASHRLQRVSNGLGTTLTFAYSADLLSQVTDMAGRSIAYGYTNGNLTSFRDAMGSTWRYAYDDWHLLIATYGPKAPNQAVLTNSYDDLERVQTQTDALGNVSTYYYGGFRTQEMRPDGSSVTHLFARNLDYIGHEDATGKLTQMRYDGLRRLRTITDRLGNDTSFAFDPQSGNLASHTDAEGQTTTWAYAQRPGAAPGNLPAYDLTRLTYADGSHSDWTYDSKGNQLTYTDALSKTWRFTYNNRGQPLTVTNPTGGVITYAYNADGTLASFRDADTGATTLAYDAYKRPSIITRPDGVTVRMTYDLADRLLTATDERGKVTRYTYDANGNRLTATDPLSNTITYAYDVLDRLTQATDSLGRTSRLGYDSMGRLASTIDRNAFTTTVRYDSRGWLDQVVDATGHASTFAWNAEPFPAALSTPLGLTTTLQTDRMGRTTAITDPLGSTTQLGYDDLGRLTSAGDRVGRVSTYEYDAAGRLVSAIQPLVGTAIYARNDVGQVADVRDLNGKTWGFHYSGMGRLIADLDPLGNQRSFSYDSRGRLTQTTYPGGGSAAYTYDASSNLTRVTHSGGPTFNYTYDDDGRLLTASDSSAGPSSGVTLTYDARGDVTNASDGPAAFGATYDNGRRLRTVSYAGQVTITYTHDARNLLTRVEDSLSHAWASLSYDQDARLVSVGRSNGVTTAYSYNAAGQLTRISETGAGGALADQQYTLNREGEPTEVVGAVPLEASPAPLTSSLSYDAAGRVNSPGYAYDARGRQTGAPGKSFAYDSASHLVRVTADGISVTMTYNGRGDLRTRTAGDTTLSYYHHYALGLAPIVAESPDGRAYKRFYVYTPGGALLYSIDAETRQAAFYHFDRLGSTLFTSGGGGAVQDAYAYDPYGDLLGHSGASDQPFTYVGRYGVRWEPVGELYQMGLRYYDPLAARFLTRDAVWPVLTDPSSLNPYGYARQNPLRYLDPLGTSVENGVSNQLAGDGPDWSEYLALHQAQMHEGLAEFDSSAAGLSLEGQMYWLEASSQVADQSQPEGGYSELLDDWFLQECNEAAFSGSWQALDTFLQENPMLGLYVESPASAAPETSNPQPPAPAPPQFTPTQLSYASLSPQEYEQKLSEYQATYHEYIENGAGWLMRAIKAQTLSESSYLSAEDKATAQSWYKTGKALSQFYSDQAEQVTKEIADLMWMQSSYAKMQITGQ